MIFNFFYQQLVISLFGIRHSLPRYNLTVFSKFPQQMRKEQHGTLIFATLEKTFELLIDHEDPLREVVSYRGPLGMGCSVKVPLGQ